MWRRFRSTLPPKPSNKEHAEVCAAARGGVHRGKPRRAKTLLPCLEKRWDRADASTAAGHALGAAEGADSGCARSRFGYTPYMTPPTGRPIGVGVIGSGFGRHTQIPAFAQTPG